MKLLKGRGRDVMEDIIFWVLTVPAVWNDAAKQFMREAAIKADIKKDKLKIAIEPDAASYFCKYVPVSTWSGRDQLVQFVAAPPGTKYMVVDLGGKETFYLQVSPSSFIATHRVNYSKQMGWNYSDYKSKRIGK